MEKSAVDSVVQSICTRINTASALEKRGDYQVSMLEAKELFDEVGKVVGQLSEALHRGGFHAPDWELAEKQSQLLLERAFDYPKGHRQSRKLILLGLALEAWANAHFAVH